MKLSYTNKPKVMLTFRIGGENGGPYVSHRRIAESKLKECYEFIPLMVPVPKHILTPKGMAQLVGEIKKAQPDILHFAGLQMEGFAVLLAAKLARVPKTICAIHGSSLDAIGFTGYKRFLMEKLENWTLKNATACYGVSSFVAAWPRVKQYAKNCMGYVYNLSQTPNEIQKSSESVRQKFGIGENEIVVISTGRIILDKGYDILQKVITSEESWDNVRFLIVGDGTYRETMEAAISNSDVKKHVIFTGYRNDVANILEESDIFVICTRHETFCNSVVEASRAALPVVATGTGGICEIVEDGMTGFLVPPEDDKTVTEKLKLLIDRPELRQKMGRRGQQRVNEIFSEDAITKKLHSFYQLLLSQNE